MSRSVAASAIRRVTTASTSARTAGAAALEADRCAGEGAVVTSQAISRTRTRYMESGL